MFIQICISCQKWRDPEESKIWFPSWLMTRKSATFSHGYCTKCGAMALENYREERRLKRA